MERRRWAVGQCDTCDLPTKIRFDDNGEIEQVLTTCAEPKPDSCPAMRVVKQGSTTLVKAENVKAGQYLETGSGDVVKGAQLQPDQGRRSDDVGSLRLRRGQADLAVHRRPRLRVRGRRMSFGRRKAIIDKYGEQLEVNVDEGDAEVFFHLTQLDPSAAAVPNAAISAFSPDDADNLAEQLKAAAAHARTLTPHD